MGICKFSPQRVVEVTPVCAEYLADRRDGKLVVIIISLDVFCIHCSPFQNLLDLPFIPGVAPDLSNSTQSWSSPCQLWKPHLWIILSYIQMTFYRLVPLKPI